jgi:hypothetical protein
LYIRIKKVFYTNCVPVFVPLQYRRLTLSDLLLFVLASSYEQEQKIVAINSNARYAGVGIAMPPVAETSS